MENQNPQIRVLPNDVAEKIAAGEVVERPIAVIKELVENSIDALATKIEISVEDAGFASIQIADNGHGMDQHNLKLCLLRHATSKIQSADDLFKISTMGFRGEALASIAAVSRLKIVSSSTGDGTAYCVTSEGGVHSDIIPAVRSRGTTITIQDLFYNVPARKKFMKTQKGESLAIIRTLEQLIIPFPSIHFTLSIDNKKIFDCPSVATPLDRIVSIAGGSFTKELIVGEGERDDIEVLLYVSTPLQLQNRPRFQSLYVNLRRIDSDSVTYSIREAFSKFLGGPNKPSFFCFLTIDPSRIDVNIHPTKQQIKFDNDRHIFGFIYSVTRDAIERAMSQATIQAVETDPRLNQINSLPNPITESKEEAASISSESSSLEHLLFPSDNIIPFESKNLSYTAQSTPNPSLSSVQESEQLSLPLEHFTQNNYKEIDSQADPRVQLTKDDSPLGNWELIPCYQIHGLFILAQIKNGILLIDQHAAHERVLYEQALEDVKRGRATSQQLLFPIVMELSTTEKAIVDAGLGYFSAFGYDISDFGGNSIAISAIPAFLKDNLVQDSIRSMIEYLLDGKNMEIFSETEKRFSAAFACGAAIKAGQKLSQEEMNGLLNSLFSSKNPYTCPHGRPTLVRISIEELTRRFLR